MTRAAVSTSRPPVISAIAVARWLWVPSALSAGLALIAAATHYIAPADVESTVTQMLVNVVLVVGLYVFAGNSGVLSFGHVAFAGVGAYVSALFTIPVVEKEALFAELPGALRWILPVHLSSVQAALLGGAVAAAIAVVLCPPLMRMKPLQASIGTFAVLVIAQIVFSQTDDVTQGLAGIYGVPGDTTLWVAFAWAAASVFVAWTYQRSRHGLRLQATREHERAAESAGIVLWHERSFAFVLSAFVMGCGGAVYAHYLSFVLPADFYLAATFAVVAPLIIGGMGSLTGAVTGLVVVTAVNELVRRLEISGIGPIEPGALSGAGPLVVAAVLLAILIGKPRGLTESKELPLPEELRPAASRGE
jgi:branched-chain amino acid transport system permease protein